MVYYFLPTKYNFPFAHTHTPRQYRVYVWYGYTEQKLCKLPTNLDKDQKSAFGKIIYLLLPHFMELQAQHYLIFIFISLAFIKNNYP